MNKEQIIFLYAKEIKTEKGKFYASTANINGKWYKIKFVDTCAIKPKKEGFYYLTLNIEDCCLQAGKLYTKKDGTLSKGSPTIWVREATKIRAETEEEAKERNIKSMAGVFADDDEEVIPF